MSQPAPQQLRFEIASQTVHIEEAVERSEAFLRRHVDDDDFVYRVLLPVSEAVTNAIRHGNGLDVSKRVLVDLEVSRSSVEVIVEDEGVGFDREGLTNPLEDENLLNEGGRGIYLIETMADDVAFENEGRRIRMRFLREVAPE